MSLRAKRIVLSISMQLKKKCGKPIAQGLFLYWRDTQLHPKGLHIRSSDHTGLGNRYMESTPCLLKDVLESMQCLVHITCHRQCVGSVYISLREFNPNVYCRFHVDCDKVIGS